MRLPERRRADQNLSCADSLNQFLAGFEEGNLLRWHVDSGSGFRIASNAGSSLPRLETSESTNFNLVAGSQCADDAVKYGANNDVGLLYGQLNGLANPFGQIRSGHLEHSRCITKQSNTVWTRRRANRSRATAIGCDPEFPGDPLSDRVSVL